MDLLRRHVWLVPLAFAVTLAAVGWTSQRALERTMKQQLASKLESTLAAGVAALDVWASDQKAVVEVWAQDPRVRALVLDLLRVEREAEDPAAALRAAPAQSDLRALVARVVERHGYIGCGVLDPGGLFLAAFNDALLGTRPGGAEAVRARILEGETVVTPPLRWGPSGGQDTPPVILAGAPVRDPAGRVVALFGFSLDPEREFSSLLTVARSEESGETYVFDTDGRLLSPSRFEAQLRDLGLLREGRSSVMSIQVRDPGGDLTSGHVPKLPLKARPLTRMAASAVSGENGVDVEGYRDYRGVEVAGAWSWVTQLGIGITSEIDVAEAYRGLFAVQQRFWGVIALLVVGALGLFLYSFVIVRLRSQVDEARQLGRYRIERKLGSGGMGTVYLASHALLRRPTAIKLLRSDAAGREALERFEREVQVSGSLSHPNTIEIYDYGHTPDGTFYYAMEYLTGLTVGQCVEEDGPQPEARVVHVMWQACASLAEAHSLGLIHRDLKPSNLMLCEVGGMVDFVKVLDFGLVRHEHQPKDVALTDVSSLTGTPLYMPPESVKTPDTLDARGDVYQLGAIAYYLLVGRHLFQGDSAYEVMARHVSTPPTPPSEALGRPVSPSLESVILRCLEKDPKNRPADAGELLDALERCEVAGSWGQREARDWWDAWRARHPQAEDGGPDTTSHPSAYTVDFLARLRGRDV